MFERRTEDQELFEILANSSPAGIYILQDGKFQFVNKMFQTHTGYSQAELVGTAALDLVVPEDRAQVRQGAIEMLKGERKIPYEYRVINKFGTERWNLETVAPIQFKGWRGTIGSFSDITELKHTEALLRRSLDDTAHNQRLLLAFAHAAKAVHRAISPEEIYQTALREMSKIGYHTAILTLSDDHKHLIVSHVRRPSMPAQGLPGSAEKALSPQFRRFRLASGSAYHRAVKELKTVFVNDFAREMTETVLEPNQEAAHHFAKFMGIDQVILSPLVVHGDICGLLYVGGEDLSQADEPAIDAFASEISIAVEKALLIQKVQERATTDSLTGLHNRRHFYDLLESEARRAAKSDRPLSLIMASVDDFKIIVDTHGQQAADGLLRNLASVLRRAVRPTDALARYGGEEFAIMLPNTSYQEAAVVAERASRAVESYEFKVAAQVARLTLAVAIASSETARGDSIDDLIKAAEMALYEARQQEKNRESLAG